MQTTKMSLANIQGKLSRTEMKNIMAGSGTSGCGSGCSGSCTIKCGGITYDNGTCRSGPSGTCNCSIVC